MYCLTMGALSIGDLHIFECDIWSCSNIIIYLEE